MCMLSSWLFKSKGVVGSCEISLPVIGSVSVCLRTTAVLLKGRAYYDMNQPFFLRSLVRARSCKVCLETDVKDHLLETTI